MCHWEMRNVETLLRTRTKRAEKSMNIAHGEEVGANRNESDTEVSGGEGVHKGDYEPSSTCGHIRVTLLDTVIILGGLHHGNRL